MLEKEGCLLDVVVVCVGGGLNVIGMFVDFIDEFLVCLVGVEFVGKGVYIKDYGVVIGKGIKGILYGVYMYIMQDQDGQIEESYLVLVGLDYFVVGF